MTDKQTPLILDALARAAAEPAGVTAYAAKGEQGLFPNSASGKAAARRCLDEQLLRTIPSPSNGIAREVCTITDRGLRRLMEAVHPKKILEDFVRVLEERGDQVREMLETLGSMARNLEGLKASVAAVLPRVETAKIHVPMNRFSDSTSDPGDLVTSIHSYLASWRPDGGGDCPLPELYRSVAGGRPDWTLGRFHDAIRWLHDAGRIYLHPWTGPLYAMPEPGYAIMVGHNVAYYASAR